MNTRLIPAGLLGVVLFLPAAGGAVDTAAVVAALPNEAAECRYLLSLCQPAEVAFRKVHEVITKLARAQRLPLESRTPVNLEALSQLQAQEKAAHNEFNTPAARGLRGRGRYAR